MEPDEWSRVILVAGMVGLACGGWYRSRSTSARRRLGDAFVNRNLAVIEQRFVPGFDARLRRGEQVTFVGGVVGAALFAVVPLPADDAFLSLLALDCAIFSLIVVGRALFSAWSASQPFAAETGAPRMARLRAMTPSDLVPPWVRWPSRVGVALTVAGMAWALTHLELSPAAKVMVAFSTSCLVASLTAAEVVALRVSASPEPALDTAHLYWQDALRADDLVRSYLESLQAASLLVMSGGVAVAMTSTEEGLGAFATPWSILASLLLMASLLCYLAWTLGEPWFRRRLWPHLAKGEVVVPGRQAAA